MSDADNQEPITKYEKPNFIGTFITRQYSPLVQVTDPSFPTEAHTIQEITAGSEQFYQTISALCQPYLSRESHVLDLGCAAGRLTVEAGRRGVALALGIDRSPLMLEYAHMIACGTPTDRIEFKRRISRVSSVNAAIRGYGLSNCLFAMGDAQQLPFKSNSFDLVLCVNLLHRVPRPISVISEIERLIRPESIVVVSNSYDWSKLYTEREHWFDDFRQIINKNVWQLLVDLDGVSHITRIFDRKYTQKLNHVQVYKVTKQRM
jgi:SAM-dependent methyltransferase